MEKDDSRLTLPKLPVPSVFSMIYWPTRGFCRGIGGTEPDDLPSRDLPPGTGGAGLVAMAYRMMIDLEAAKERSMEGP